MIGGFDFGSDPVGEEQENTTGQAHQGPDFELVGARSTGDR